MSGYEYVPTFSGSGVELLETILWRERRLTQDEEAVIELGPSKVAAVLCSEIQASPWASTCAERKCRHARAWHKDGVCMAGGCDCPGWKDKTE